MSGHSHPGMDHSHHHGMDHSLHSANATTEPTTTVATIVNAVLTTMMEHGADHHHAVDNDSHADHNIGSEHISQDISGVHTAHGSSSTDHMQMYFQFGVDTTILFKDWVTTSTQGIIWSMIGIFILAVMYEGLKFFREHLFKKYFTSLEYSSVSVLGDDGKPVTEVHKVARNRMLSWPHFLQTSLHIIQMIVSYFLMLIFMTYNGWLCIAVIGGAGFGYFLFGWRKATVVDITEHCH